MGPHRNGEGRHDRGEGDQKADREIEAPAMTTNVSPIATRALTIIENRILLRFDSVRNQGEATPKPIAVFYDNGNGTPPAQQA